MNINCLCCENVSVSINSTGIFRYFYHPHLLLHYCWKNEKIFWQVATVILASSRSLYLEVLTILLWIFFLKWRLERCNLRWHDKYTITYLLKLPLGRDFFFQEKEAFEYLFLKFFLKLKRNFMKNTLCPGCMFGMLLWSSILAQSVW